ncbi:nucleotidyltransferase family protein [Aquibium microcysteis]|uniref:nucleotidyltransferase family protein n=1 Tax=Aquibium microcysteis TaxID=675281 RepID=UPI00165CF1FC|nr:nucleotidyltransferase family protein [Aquibium microcysteis]
MRPSEALAKHRDEVLAIIARYPVTNPRVFGSVARGEDVEGSDIDILVDPVFEVTTFAHLGELRGKLADVLGIEVDVSTPGGLRPQTLGRIAPELLPL